MTGGQSRAVVPQYAKIAADLRGKIKDGTYGPGALLPSRNEITTMFGIPDATIVLVTHATLYDRQRQPVEHSRYTWPTDAVRVSDYYTYPPAT
jgi:DNA-binding GntR family transcriptional regulator